MHKLHSFTLMKKVQFFCFKTPSFASIHNQKKSSCCLQCKIQREKCFGCKHHFFHFSEKIVKKSYILIIKSSYRTLYCVNKNIYRFVKWNIGVWGTLQAFHCTKNAFDSAHKEFSIFRYRCKVDIKLKLSLSLSPLLSLFCSLSLISRKRKEYICSNADHLYNSLTTIIYSYKHCNLNSCLDYLYF